MNLDKLNQPSNNLPITRSISHSFEKLSTISKKHRPLSESEGDILNKIKKLFMKIISAIIDPKREFDTYRTQEHLLFGAASYPGTHYAFFLNALEKSGLSSKAVQNLKEQISELDSQYGIISKPHGDRKLNFILGEALWVKNIKESLDKLTPGESKLVEIVSQGHAMMIRIEKKENNTFNLYFTNTGLGISTHEDFHPVKIEEDGTQTYRLVAQIENISSEALFQGEFLKNLIQAIDSNKDQINNIYRVLRTLCNEKTKLNQTDDPKHWKSQQIVGSCAASTVLTTIHSVLSPEEQALLETYMQVQALVKSYKLLKSNSDRSNTRKIMVLDLIQTLKQNPILELQDKQILLNIEKDVRVSMKMKEPEIIISKSSRISIDSFISENNGKYELSAFFPVISNEKHLFPPSVEKRLQKKQTSKTLKAYLSMDNTTFKTDQKYQVVKRNDRWVGVDFSAAAALVSFYISNGNQEQIEFYMNDLLEKLKTQPTGQQQYHLDTVLNLLATQLFELDKTRSGVARTLFLSGFVLQQLCLRCGIDFQEIQKKLWQIDPHKIRKQFYPFFDSFKEKIPDAEQYFFKNAVQNFVHAKYLYANLQVKKHLDENNIWAKGLAAIDVHQPEIKPPSTEQPTSSFDYNLQEKLEQSDPDVTSHEQAMFIFEKWGT